MLKLNPFLLRKPGNWSKLYSDSVGKLAPPLSLTDALGAHTEKLAKPVMETDLEPIIDSSFKAKSSVVEGKKATGKIVPKTKRGKKCGDPKPVQPQDPGSTGGSTDGSGIVDKCGFYDTHKTNAKKWKTLSYIAVPFAFGLSAFILATKEEGPEPEYIPYEYMYRRTRRFAWRDGKTSAFHGPNNFIPQEEEERLDREEKEKQARGEKVTPRYKKRVDEREEKLKRREQRVKEELERRQKRQESQ